MASSLGAFRSLRGIAAPLNKGQPSLLNPYVQRSHLPSVAVSGSYNSINSYNSYSSTNSWSLNRRVWSNRRCEGGSMRCFSSRNNIMPTEAPVVIIGGGVTGASLMYHLEKKGIQSVLLEKGELTSGATWHAAGLTTFFHGGNNLRLWHDYSCKLFTKWREEGSIHSFHTPGSMRLIEKGNRARLDEVYHHQAKAKLYRDLYGCEDMNIISPSEIAKLHPLVDTSTLDCALYTQNDGHIDPSAVTNAFINQTKELYKKSNQVNPSEGVSNYCDNHPSIKINPVGSTFKEPLTPSYPEDASNNPNHISNRIQTFAQVIECQQRRSDGKWEVVVKKIDPNNRSGSDNNNNAEIQTIVCEHVVNAAGLWCQEVAEQAGIHMPAVVLQHQYVITEDIPELKAIHKERGGKQLPVLRDLVGSFYLRDERDGFLIGPYEQESLVVVPGKIPEDQSFFLFDGDIDRLIPHIERGSELVPVLGNSGIKTVLNGPTCWPSDGNHLIGPSYQKLGYWYACAESYGIAHSGGLGAYLAHWIAHGEPPYELNECDPSRYGEWADNEFVSRKVKETYGSNNHVHFPNENYPAARPIKKQYEKQKDIIEAMAERGCVFGLSGGWEVPIYFDTEGGNTKDSVEKLRTIELAKKVVGGFVDDTTTTTTISDHTTTTIINPWVPKGNSEGTWRRPIYAQSNNNKSNNNNSYGDGKVLVGHHDGGKDFNTSHASSTGHHASSTGHHDASSSHVVKENNGLMNHCGVLYWPFSKYEVTGPDAQKFMDKLIANHLPKDSTEVKLGHMMTPGGRIWSEVTILKPGKDHYYLVSYPAMEKFDLRWMMQVKQGNYGDNIDTEKPTYNVKIESVSHKFATLMINGPSSVDILSKNYIKNDDSNPNNDSKEENNTSNNSNNDSKEENPFLNKWVPWSWKKVNVFGIDCRALKVSFIGELGWELHVPHENVAKLYRSIFEYDNTIVDWGGVCMNQIRLEKGIPLFGKDFTKDHSPFDIGLVGKFIQLGNNKSDYIGKKALLNELSLLNGTVQNGAISIKTGKPLLNTPVKYTPKMKLVTLEVKNEGFFEKDSEKDGDNIHQAADITGNEPLYYIDNNNTNNTNNNSPEQCTKKERKEHCSMIGYAVSGQYGMNTQKSLALAYVETQFAKDNIILHVDLLGQKVPAVVKEKPLMDVWGVRQRKVKSKGAKESQK